MHERDRMDVRIFITCQSKVEDFAKKNDALEIYRELM